ncbi:alkylmercury lyase family protein [Nocardia sp. GCM10030253]|uniref:alkylmercury lyase family protein n=1 Tax=Nocardia sp. GCM10030253 TaxID=3273404 RepID=UPI00363797FE
MKLEILQVPDCPNVAVLEHRIRQVTASQIGDVEIIHHVIDDPADAATAGMTGSPTLLVDGRDPFATPGLIPSLSCRLYRREDGGLEGPPSIAALRAALHYPDTVHEASTVQLSGGDCCTPSGDSSASTLSAWRGAARPADPAERAVHHAVLRAFATSGRPPSIADLTTVAIEYTESAQEILTRLHVADVIRLDTSGAIASAYPFSALPTEHQVQIVGGARVYAMCAIDALGIPAMLDTDAKIESADPVSSEPITVTIHNQTTTAHPATTVVFVGAQSSQGPSADTCCNYLNFFTDRHSAQGWADAHPHVYGGILELADAQQLGKHIFGDQLR